jgi:hypothetical protein
LVVLTKPRKQGLLSAGERIKSGWNTTVGVQYMSNLQTIVDLEELIRSTKASTNEQDNRISLLLEEVMADNKAIEAVNRDVTHFIFGDLSREHMLAFLNKYKSLKSSSMGD